MRNRHAVAAGKDLRIVHAEITAIQFARHCGKQVRPIRTPDRHPMIIQALEQAITQSDWVPPRTRRPSARLKHFSVDPVPAGCRRAPAR
jgi:UTP:GlnB (protein PII) uridylyltransferase